MRVEVSIGGRKFYAFVTSGDGFMCSDERLLRLGLGEVPPDAVADVRVTWPNGDASSYAGLTPGHTWIVVQGEASPFQLH